MVAHPSYQVLRAPAGPHGVVANAGASFSPPGYSPAQIRAAYGINAITFGTVSGDGRGQTIAIVDAYDDPGLANRPSAGFASSDLARFDAQYGLANPPSFLKVNQYGNTGPMPPTDPTGPGGNDWEVEEALDVEWAHAIAPGASLILVECNSNSFADLIAGVITAAGLPGVSAVSMSWGDGEFAGETATDSAFTTPAGHQGVTFLSSTGDNGSPSTYPACAPNVLAVGGTTLSLSANGTYRAETAWAGSGGGISTQESEPAYQNGVQNTGFRTNPDVAFDADPYPGVAIYDSYDAAGGSPWVQIGGTSVACPCWAGLIAIANQGRVAGGGVTLDGPSETLPALYSLPSSDFHDITSGGNGGFRAGPGYDEVTGLGTPRANVLVPDLAHVPASPNERFVAQLYRDLLGREPDAAGLAGWTSLLERGVSRSQVALGIENSTESHTRQLEALYQQLLGRSADQGGLAYWVDFLDQGGTLRQVETQILGSDEYFHGHGGDTSAGFVTALYQNILGRAPDAAGVSYWTTYLNGGAARSSLASLIVTSAEADTDIVQADYELYLHRPADPAGLSAFVGAMEQGVTEEVIVAEIVGSSEYFALV
jgi:hypothetical protein